jgi:spore coat protein U domain-containing protein, fimbrial subunit CupE1/2/3/6
MSLNRRMQLLLGLGAVAALMGAQEEAQALTSTLEVTASVPDACTLDSGTIPFGTYNSGQTGTLDTTGGFNVECSSAADVHIKLDGGLHLSAGGNGRAMASPDTSDFLNYELYKGTAVGLTWTENLPIAYPLTSGTNSISVFGVILGSQIVAGGEYSDTVQITLTFD